MSIMATIRWCPIFPKWDIYQPLLHPPWFLGGVECEPGEGPFWSLFAMRFFGFSQPELKQKIPAVWFLVVQDFHWFIIVHIKPNDTHNPLSHQIVGYMMLYVITATAKQDRKVFPGRYRCTMMIMMYFIFPEIFPGFPPFNPFHTFLSVFMGLPFEPPIEKTWSRNRTSRLTWWLNLHLRFDVDIISSTFFVWVVSWPSNPKKRGSI